MPALDECSEFQLLQNAAAQQLWMLLGWHTFHFIYKHSHVRFMVFMVILRCIFIVLFLLCTTQNHIHEMGGHIHLIK